jgi:hypothetical protein
LPGSLPPQDALVVPARAMPLNPDDSYNLEGVRVAAYQEDMNDLVRQCFGEALDNAGIVNLCGLDGFVKTNMHGVTTHCTRHSKSSLFLEYNLYSRNMLI